MATCNIDVDLISPDEYIGDSLQKINSNFTKLKEEACKVEERLNNQVNIRTFFYYGPNAAIDPESNMQSGVASRPSDLLIENFVNDADQLNLKPISENGDQVYIIYQKTGWYTNYSSVTRFDSGQVPFQRKERYAVTYWVPDPGIGGGGSKKKKGISGKCWVAREVYKQQSPQWQIFKDWLYNQNKCKPLQYIYTKYGEAFSKWISNKPFFKKIIRKLMGLVVNEKILDSYSFITTPRGVTNIDQLKPGDIVFGFDPKTGELLEQKTLKVQKTKNNNLYRITHKFGQVILHANQLVYVEKGTDGEYKKYKAVKKLTTKDNLITETNNKSPIQKIEKLTDSKNIYEIEINKNHNYILNGIKLHNGWVTVWRTRIVTYYVGYSWSTRIDDSYRLMSPTFVIYRLTYNGSNYVMDSGYPKFSRATTASTNLWNQPQRWPTY